MNAPEDLRSRTKKYALRIIRLFRALPRKDPVALVLGKQLLRSATSVAAHYREACRAKIQFGFHQQTRRSEQELDESELWLELLSDAGIVKVDLLAPLLQETNELIAILVTMTKNVKRRR